MPRVRRTGSLRRVSGKKARRWTQRLISRIYSLLRSGIWRVCYVRLHGNRRLARRLEVPIHTLGTVDFEKHIIYIDHRFDVISTLAHECLHIIYEDASEDEVRKLEVTAMKFMSKTQATRLHRQMGYCLM